MGTGISCKEKISKEILFWWFKKEKTCPGDHESSLKVFLAKRFLARCPCIHIWYVKGYIILYWSVSLITFYLIRQPALWIKPPLYGGPLYKLWAALHFFKLIMTSTGWGAVSTIFFFKCESFILSIHEFYTYNITNNLYCI